MKEYGVDKDNWLVGIPEELLPEIKEVVYNIRTKYWTIVREVQREFECLKAIESRKDFALSVRNKPYYWMYFQLLDNKDEWRTKLIDHV
jgi:hypothetical protein